MNWEILYVQSTGSTNEDLFRSGLAGEREGRVLVAEEQTAGRGRMDRKWNSPMGAGLYVSVLVRPRLNIRRAGLLSFCAANAMRAAVAEAGLTDTRIKWPNDLVCEGKKICGILSACRARDGELDFAVIGTGLNLKRGSYPEELADRAACLAEFGVRAYREDILRSYLYALEPQVKDLERGGEAVFKNLRDHCVTLGRQVQVSGETNLTGWARDIGPEGELIVESADGILHPVVAGDVSVRGIMGYV